MFWCLQCNLLLKLEKTINGHCVKAIFFPFLLHIVGESYAPNECN
jgi:hypothetical protein